MKKNILAAALLVFTAVLCVVYAQDYELVLVGVVKDYRRLPEQNKQNAEFTFVRLIYNGRIPGYIKNWYTDYPKGDQALVAMLGRSTGAQIAEEPRAIPILHPDLFNYPMVYSLEAGQMLLDDPQRKRMREYLERGGFWMIDDFWGTHEWDNFESEMRKIFPECKIVDIPQSHIIFHNFFDIDEVRQIPNVGYATCHDCPTWELDGYQAKVRGVFDEKGRLMVFINHNTHLMDAAEWADYEPYAYRFSAYSYRVFTNAVIYGMTH